MMINPSIDQLTKGKINRYELVIAISKVARVITDEYCEQRERAELMIRNNETDKSLASLIKGNIRDKKAVENAVQAIADGEFEIVAPADTIETEE
ncbi:MAG: DNA-directed RNA polymerase subunit omega [Eubacteriales bacterium]